MRSTFSGIEISKRSLYSHQTALTTTAHNMANVNTKGYSRQVVDLTASRPMEAIGMMRSNMPGQIGTGVEFESIRRLREGFLDHQYQNEYTNLNEWLVRQDTLEKIELFMAEPSDTGIRQVMDNFWNSWHQLSEYPDNLETRAVVKESALAMTDAFNHLSKQLADFRADLTENIQVVTTQGNTLVGQLAQLNQEIYRIEGLGNNANDLRDQRDLLMDELSGLVNISYTEQADGYEVRMGETVLVTGGTATDFTEELVTASAESGDLNGGKLAGLIYSRDELVTQYDTQLEALVKTMADAVNDLHQQGYTLNEPAELGGAFFTYDADNPAGTISVAADIQENVLHIAASTRTYIDADGVEQVVRGNNELALEMAALKNNPFDFFVRDEETDGENEDGEDGSSDETREIILNNGTFDEFFRAVIGELGVQTSEAGRRVANQHVLVDQIDIRRQSVSGVSLDEEMSNMIKFQHGYNAAARAMTTFDELLDRVINGMGIVGR